MAGVKQKMKLTLTLLLIVFPFSCWAEMLEGDTYLSVSAFKENNGDHSGVELSGLSHIKDNFAVRVSGVLYTGINNSKIDDVFAGYSLSGYIFWGSKYIRPYLGAGLFLGETFNCSDTEEKNGDCKEDFTLSMYPEVGLAFNVNRFHFFPYIRRYFDTNNKASQVNAYGVYIGYKL